MFKVARIATRSRLEELALPADRLATLRTITAQRKGTVLVTGPSGTGKTLAAEALAGTVGRELVRVDLARVVSRFFGETEKNLDRVFAAAEASGAVLFFDEADALFGKRSEVQSSHDRYANVEISYLLDKVERYSGIVVLACNLPQNIETAVARFRGVVKLPWPPNQTLAASRT